MDAAQAVPCSVGTVKTGGKVVAKCKRSASRPQSRDAPRSNCSSTSLASYMPFELNVLRNIVVPPEKPWNDDSTVNTNQQWFPVVSKWCRMSSIHSMSAHTSSQLRCFCTFAWCPGKLRGTQRGRMGLWAARRRSNPHCSGLSGPPSQIPRWWVGRWPQLATGYPLRGSHFKIERTCRFPTCLVVTCCPSNSLPLHVT